MSAVMCFAITPTLMIDEVFLFLIEPHTCHWLCPLVASTTRRLLGLAQRAAAMRAVAGGTIVPTLTSRSPFSRITDDFDSLLVHGCSATPDMFSIPIRYLLL